MRFIMINLKIHKVLVVWKVEKINARDSILAVGKLNYIDSTN
jgi:hypothetical protein